MSGNYPGGLDDTNSLPDPSANNPPNNPGHAELHTEENAILRALETKLGWGSSTPSATGYVLTSMGGGQSMWRPVTGGGGSSSPLTTKGDIWVFSTQDTRLPVGTDSYILSADSTQTTGLKWIPAPNSAVWGAITGTLSSQTDLNTALNARLLASNNLSDLGSASTARTNLGLGSLATKSTVTLTTDVTGILPVANGGTGANLSSTGGTSQVLKQTTSGGTVTVGQLAASDLSNGTSGSGAVVLATSPVITTGTVAADPITNLGIASKQYVDNQGTTTITSNETPGGSINGSNVNFTTASTFATGSLQVYLNGQRLVSGVGNDYVEVTQGFTMQYAPATGDVLLVGYLVTNSHFIQGSNSIIVQEIPSGTINGATTLFTVLQGKYVANTLEVYLNGLMQSKTTDYTETTPGSGTFTFTTAPLTGDDVRVNYQFSTGANGNADTVDGYHGNDLMPIGTLLPYAGRTAPSYYLMCYGQPISRTTYANLFNALVPLVGNPTVTIASPGVFTLNSHGFINGDTVYLTTTGALPTGLSTNTLYYVVSAATNTFSLAATFGGTAINTSGSQSGTHSIYACPYGLGDGSTTFNVPDARGRAIAGADAMGGTAASRISGSTTQGVNGNLGASGGEQAHTMTQSELVAHNHAIQQQIGSSTGIDIPAGGQTSSTGSFFNTAAMSNTGSTTPFNVIQPTLVTNYIIKAL